MSVGGVDAELVEKTAFILAQEIDRHGPSTKSHLRSRLVTAKRAVLDVVVKVSSSGEERYGIGPAAPPRPRRRPTTGAQRAQEPRSDVSGADQRGTT